MAKDTKRRNARKRHFDKEIAERSKSLVIIDGCIDVGSGVLRHPEDFFPEIEDDAQKIMVLIKEQMIREDRPELANYEDIVSQLLTSGRCLAAELAKMRDENDRLKNRSPKNTRKDPGKWDWTQNYTGKSEAQKARWQKWLKECGTEMELLLLWRRQVEKTMRGDNPPKGEKYLIGYVAKSQQDVIDDLNKVQTRYKRIGPERAGSVVKNLCRWGYVVKGKIAHEYSHGATRRLGRKYILGRRRLFRMQRSAWSWLAPPKVNGLCLPSSGAFTIRADDQPPWLKEA